MRIPVSPAPTRSPLRSASPRRLVRATAPVVALLLGAGALLPLAGCASSGIAMREAFGYTKREQLVDRVEDARDGQEEAKEQFSSALEEFIAVTGVETGELEAAYENLADEYERCRSAADEVRSRIDSVELVATKLFDEWEDELAEYTSASFREASERQLRDTRRQYDRLVGSMRSAESKMDPVLAAFGDQVLFLKHNLNARAIASLGDNVTQIRGDVDRLIAEMNDAIAESNRFIEGLGAGGTA